MDRSFDLYSTFWWTRVRNSTILIHRNQKIKKKLKNNADRVFLLCIVLAGLILSWARSVSRVNLDVRACTPLCYERRELLPLSPQ